jgi:hypothetical protein
VARVYESEPLTRRAAELRDEERHDEAVALLHDAVAADEPSALRELAYALLGRAGFALLRNRILLG